MRIAVHDLMMPAATVADSATVAQARDAMLAHNAAEVYVVDAGGRLRGLVPDYEFLKAELGGPSGDASILTLLCTKVETIDAAADVTAVLPKFREAWCGRVAVTRKGRLVGRLGRLEVLRLAVRLRQVAAVTELAFDAGALDDDGLAGPHFGRTRRLAPARKLSASSKPKRLRRLAAG